MTPKEEWLRYSGLIHSDDDIWLRNNVAKLFDVDQPTELQRFILDDADLFLTLKDLPAGARPNHKSEMMDRAEMEFDSRPSRR